MSTLEKIAKFLDDFRQTSLWTGMAACVENSPWHREANTAVHTQMMIQWYMQNLWEHRSDRDRMLTLVAIVFHDVGKPVERRWSEEKQRYHFSGHEQTSAKMFKAWYDACNYMLLDLGLTDEDSEALQLMLYHHVPFAYVRAELTLVLRGKMDAYGVSQAWIDLIVCDQFGRISDTHQENQNRVFIWLAKWRTWSLVEIDHDHYPRIINLDEWTGFTFKELETYK